MKQRRFLALLLTLILTVTAMPLDALAVDSVVLTQDIGESMLDEESAESADIESEDEKETREDIEDDAEFAANEIEMVDETLRDDSLDKQTEDDNVEEYAGLEGEIAAAEDTVMSGKCGDNLTWEIKDGVMTISGTGDMWDYEWNEIRPWEDAEVSELILGEGITRIGDCAFYCCSGFTGSLTIPDSVTSIGDGAFSGCSDFTGSLTIGNSVTSVGGGAFSDCSGFTGDLVIPNSVIDIAEGYIILNHAEGAFENCYGFKKLIIGNSVENIGSLAFSGCWGFAGNLTIPESITSIGSSAFSGCSGFTGNLTIPESVTSIGSYAFSGCSGFMGNLTIPESVTSIGNGAFRGCSGFTGNLTIPKSVTSISRYAFSGCSGLTGNLIIPNGVTSIGCGAFYNCSGFTGDLVIPDSVIDIEGVLYQFYSTEGAFENCKGLTGNLIIGKGVTSIGSYAFRGCSGFTGNLTIPERVTNIGCCAFSDCRGFTGDLVIPDSVIEIEGDNLYTEGAFSGCSGFTGNLIIGNSLENIGSYSFSGCSGFTGNLIIGNSVENIGSCAFSGCSGFTGNLTIPESVTSISRYAFSGCSGLTGNLIIPDSVESLGRGAFYNCSGFTGNLVIGNSVTSIGKETFYNCSGFTGDLVIPDSVINIEGDVYSDTYGAFENCNGFTGNLIIGNSVTSIGSGAFYNCSGFTGDLVIPDSVIDIAGAVSHYSYGAFENCKGFTGNLIIGNNVTNIGGSAFSGCSGFAGKLVIGNSVMHIGSGAFYNCSSFTGDLVIPDSVIDIEGYSSYYTEGAFKNCNGFTGNLIIGNNVTSIGGSVFSGCSGFTGSLTIPNSVTVIGDDAFRGCSGFTGNLTIPDSVTSIGSYVFSGCSGFTGNLIIPNGITSIGNSAFRGCSGFTGSLTISDSVTSIGSYVFSGCSGFTGNLTIPNGVTSIGSYAFSGCSGFTGNLTIPNGVTSIGSYAFSGCSGFTGNLTIPNGVTSIESYAFSDCSGFTGNLTIPNGVTSIGYDAFSGCSGFMGSLIIPDSVTSIGGGAFSGCSGFTGSLIIPDSVTKIEFGTFYNCSGFTGQLVIPDSIIDIGKADTIDDNVIIMGGSSYFDKGAFENCSGFNGSLVIGNSVASIGEKTFSGCSGLSGKIYIPSSVTDIGYHAFYDIHSKNIYGISGSYAETYAQNNNIPFIPYNFNGPQNSDIQSIGNCANIYIVESGSNTPIVGAIVNGEKTDANGYIRLAVDENVEETLVTVTADGYMTVLTCKALAVNGSYYIDMQPISGHFDIVYAKAVINGKETDLLTDKLYMEHTDKDIAAVKNGNLELEIRARGGAAEYALCQDGEVLAQSEDGKFSIPVMTGTTSNPLTALKANKNVSVKATGADGNTATKDIAIRIAPEGWVEIAEEDKTGSISIGKNLSLTLPDTIPFLGGGNTSFGLENALPFDLEVDKSGQVKVAINKDKSKSMSAHKEEYDSLSSRAKNLSDAAAAFGGTPEPFGGGYGTVKVSVSGYGEGYIDLTKAGYTKIEIGIIIKGSASMGYTQHFFAGAIPIYVGIEGGIKASAEFFVSMEVDGSKITLDGGFGKFKGEVYLTAKAGVGVDGLLSVGVSGTGSCNYLWQPKDEYNKIWLEAYLQLEASCFGWELDIWESPKATYTIYEYPTNASMGGRSFMMKELYNSSSYRMIDRGYLDKVQTKGRSLYSVSRDGGALASYVYPGADPKLIAAGDKLYLFWLQDIESRSAENRAAVVYAVSEDGKSWSVPRQLIDEKENGTSDNGVDIYVENGKIYICWQDAAEIFASGISLEEAVQKLNIAYAVMDAASGEVLSHEIITSEPGCYLQPQITASNGIVNITWIENEMTGEGGIWGTACNQHIMKYSSESKTIHTFVVGSGAERVVAMEGTVTKTGQGVVLTVDLDGDLTTAQDRLLYYDGRVAAGDDMMRLTVNAGQIGNPVVDGGKCYWFADNRIFYTEIGSDSVQTIYQNENTSLSGEFDLVSNNGNVSLVWPAIDYETGKVFLYGIDRVGADDWSEVYVLQETDSDMTGALSIAYRDEELAYAYLHVRNEADGSRCYSIYVGERQDRCDVSLNHAGYEYDDFSLGQPLPIVLEVTNHGNVSVEKLEIFMDDVSIGTVNVNLGVGETSSITTDGYTVPEEHTSYQEHVLKIQAPNETILDDNTWGLGIGYTEVGIQCSQRVQDESTWLDISVLNNSAIDSDCTLNIRADQRDGKVLYTEELGKIAGGAGKSLTVNLKKYENRYCTFFVETVTDTEDVIEGNNIQFVYIGYGTGVKGGNLVSEPVQYTVTFDSNGGSAVENQSIVEDRCATEPQSPMRDGYTFLGWYRNDGLYDFNTPVTENITLQAMWKEYETLAAPNANIKSGETVDRGFKVTLTAVAGADIYYTLDGTTPTKDDANTLKFMTPIEIQKDTTIKAFASRQGFRDSEVVTIKVILRESGDEEFAIYYELNGGTNHEYNPEKYDGTEDIILHDPIRTGYTFDGWYADAEWEQKVTTITAGSFGDKTFYAKWTPNSYCIILDANGGSVSREELSVTYDDVYGELPVPVRDGYDFEGWFTERSAGTQITADMIVKITQDSTLYAHWKKTSGGTSEEDIDSNKGLQIRLVNPDAEYQYTGSAIKPEILVTNNGRKLIAGVDYVVKYSNNIKASVDVPQSKKPKITVTGKGNLKGSTFAYFDIQRRDLKDVTVGNTLVPSGSKATPILVYENYKLGAKDFTCENQEERFTESGSMRLSGKGNFTGQIDVPITVVSKENLKKLTVTLGRENLYYDGREQKISFVVKDSKTKKELIDGTHYVVIWPDDVTNAGKIKFTVMGMGEYTGSVTKSYTIKPLKAAQDSIEVSGVKNAGYVYRSMGATVNEDLTVTCCVDGVKAPLYEGKDYKVTYSNNKKVGSTAKYTISFLGNYKGTKARTGYFTIKAAGLSDFMDGIKIVAADKIYTGKAGVYVSKLYVTIGGVALKSKDYVVNYYKDAAMTQEIKGKNNHISLASDEAAATVWVKITGRGNYAPEDESTYATTQYRVCRKENLKDLSTAKVTFVDEDGRKITKLEYTGREIEPTVKVQMKVGKTYETVPSSNYQVTYVNNVGRGRATAVITATGTGYTGSKAATFQIVAKNLQTLRDLWKNLTK